MLTATPEKESEAGATRASSSVPVLRLHLRRETCSPLRIHRGDEQLLL